MTTITCTADHSRILVGYAGGSDAPGSFGAFIATQPFGAELLSVSGWIGRWTGRYVDHHGHRAAVLTRLRHQDGRRGHGATMTIHTCLTNVWAPIGRYSFPDGATAGAVIDVRHANGTLTARCSDHGDVGDPQPFRDPAARRAAYLDAEDHARTHPPIDITGWRRWPSARLEAALDIIDDSTALYDRMADELAERDHEHRTRINNGGIMP